MLDAVLARKNSLNRLIRCVCGKKIGPEPRNFNQRVSLGRNDLLIRTFPKCASALNARMTFGTAATTATQKFRRTDSKSFCRFCAAAVPRNRQTGGRGISRSVRTYTISTSFRLCAVCDAVKTTDKRQKNPPDTGGRQRVLPDDNCLRCCYAGPICRTGIVKTTPMTGQDVQL